MNVLWSELIWLILWQFLPIFCCWLSFVLNTKKTIVNDDDDNSKEMRLNCDTIRELSTFNKPPPPLWSPYFIANGFSCTFNSWNKECSFFFATTNKNEFHCSSFIQKQDNRVIFFFVIFSLVLFLFGAKYRWKITFRKWKNLMGNLHLSLFCCCCSCFWDPFTLP